VWACSFTFYGGDNDNCKVMMNYKLTRTSEIKFCLKWGSEMYDFRKPIKSLGVCSCLTAKNYSSFAADFNIIHVSVCMSYPCI
jgi:hypothetical protein